ncbi:MAG: hypothetical protein KIS81_03365 [Maricaulaceae bacterium]|nr:hypothetical protein [Maricaulaceae bacterium]
MFSHVRLIAALGALCLPATPAFADPPPHAPAHGYRANQAQAAARIDYHHYYYDRGYDRRNFRYHEQVCRTRPAGGLSLGAVLGGGVLLDVRAGGGWMTECDRAQFSHAAYYVADHRRPYYWHNPQTRVRGAMRPGRSYRSRGQECVRVISESYGPHRRYESAEIEMCRDRRGSRWRVTGEWGR